MNLKNRLFILGLSAIALLGSQAQSKTTEMSKDKQRLAQNVSKSGYKMTDQEYWAHYEKIRSKISGRVFSFGDERLLENAFGALAKTKEGRHLIEMLPSTYLIDSKFFMGGSNEDLPSAIYFPQEERMVVRTTIINSRSKDLAIKQKLYGKNKKDVPLDLILNLKHEITHQCDYIMGRDPVNQGLSGLEYVMANIRIEAHAHASNKLDRLLYRFVDLYDFGSERNLQNFKNKNITELVKGFEKIETIALPKNEWIALQKIQADLRSGKSLERVKKEWIGKYMNDFVAQEGKYFAGKWVDNVYGYQAVRLALKQYEAGTITLKGHPKQSHKIASDFERQYACPSKSMSSVVLSSELLDIIKQADQVLKQYPDTKSKEYRQGIKAVYKKFEQLLDNRQWDSLTYTNPNLKETLKHQQSLKQSSTLNLIINPRSSDRMV